VALAEAKGAGRVPIIVGGTGLYFKTLTRGLAAIPPIPADIRAALRARLAAEGIAPLYAELVRRDPLTAHRLMPGDRARITRALEVILATGRPLADWHREGMKPALDPAGAIKIFLDADRAELYRRIDARFDAMLAAGAIDEVAALTARRLDRSLPAMKAHGVPWLIRHLNGEIAREEAAEGGKRDTRRVHESHGKSGVKQISCQSPAKAQACQITCRSIHPAGAVSKSTAPCAADRVKARSCPRSTTRARRWARRDPDTRPAPLAARCRNVYVYSSESRVEGVVCPQFMGSCRLRSAAGFFSGR
jgi:hypothetical protein